MAGVCNDCLTVATKLNRGKCTSCAANDERTRRAPAKERYPAEYRRNRAILLEGQPECYWGCGRPATTADHYPVKRADGGSHGLENLVPACRSCNSGRR